MSEANYKLIRGMPRNFTHIVNAVGPVLYPNAMGLQLEYDLSACDLAL